MIVIAHRGASAEAPENTIAAFERAVDVGADRIEMDLRASSDGVVYVAHDVVGDDHGRRRPRRLDWRGIQARAAASASPDAYPALHDVLDAVTGRIPLNLEIKERTAAALVVTELARRGLAGAAGGDAIPILVSSFDRKTMRQVRALSPALPLALLCTRLPVRLGAALRVLAARTLHLGRAAVTARRIARAHRAGVPVYVWTVDDVADMRRLAAIGVDGVFTNDPRRAREAFPR